MHTQYSDEATASHDEDSAPTPAAHDASHVPNYDQITGRLAAWSFWLGLLGVFLFQIFVIPIAAAVLGAMTVSRHDPGRLTGKWRGWIGLILGGLYTLVALARFTSS